jgi:hypothetical protein
VSAAAASAAASAASASGAGLVLELALDHRGLGATAGANNALDILVIGGQDGLQLRRERCQASFWSILPPLIPRARVLVHSCCPRNRVDDESIQM